MNGQERVRAQPGDTVTFSIEVINDGADLEDVTVRDLMSPDLDPNFHPDPFALSAGGREIFTYDFTIPADRAGVIVNKAVAFGAPAVPHRAVRIL